MVRRVIGLAVLVSLTLTAGCASRFRQLYPGMSGAQVASTMESGPTRTEQFEGGYTAWYYGEDQCVLLQEDKVVSKQETQQGTAVNAPIISVRETLRAQCLPPGVERPERREVDINLPGGSLRVEPKQQ